MLQIDEETWMQRFVRIAVLCGWMTVAFIWLCAAYWTLSTLCALMEAAQ